MGILTFLVEPFVAAIRPYLEKIMTEQQNAAVQLGNLKTNLGRISDEIKAKIQALTEAANNNSGALDPALKQAIDDLQPVTDALDLLAPPIVAEGGEATGG
jgi:ABC-type transporter Mla subunit MlaD